MARTPWELLGIAPTPDAVAIRRAYARALKTCRPDEDPERFQQLVEARARALAWHWPDPAPNLVDKPAVEPDGVEEKAGAFRLDDEGGFVLRLDGAAFTAMLDLAEPGAGGPQVHEPVRFDPLPTLTAPEPPRPEAFERLHLDRGDFKPRRDPADPLARLRGALAELLHGDGAGVRWDGAAWRNLAREAAELDIVQHRRLRDALIRDVLPRLPELPPYDAARVAYFADQGPAAAMDALETGFAFSRNQVQLAGMLGQAAAVRALGWIEYARREVPPSRQTPGQREALALVRRLTGTDGMLAAPRPWNTADCRQLLALLGRLAPGERDPCVVALLHALAETLPPDFDEGVRTYASGSSYAATVELIEEALQLEGAGRATLPPGAVVPPHYATWLRNASRLRGVTERREQQDYRDAHGIPRLPVDDAAIAIWTQGGIAAFWEAARRNARWPVCFDWRAFLFPVTELASLCLNPGLGTVVLLLAGWSATIIAAAVMADGPWRNWPATLAFTLIILARVPFAFAYRRLAVLLAMRRIKRADRDGVSAPEGREPRIRAPAPGWTVLRRALEASFLVSALFSASQAFTWSDRQEQAYQSGQSFAAQGKFANASVAYDEALRLDPGDMRAVYQRAVSDYRRGALKPALDGLDRTVAADPGNADATAFRALALMGALRFDDALRDADRVLALRPGQSAALNDRALVYEKMGDRARAMEGFTAALASDPRNGSALANRGRVREAAGDYSGAITDFTAALDPAVDTADLFRANALFGRGWSHIALGDYGSALADFAAMGQRADWRRDAQRASGFALFYAGAFADAADAFSGALQQGRDPYALLFWHIAKARSGSADPKTFADMVFGSESREWPPRPGKVVRTEWPRPAMRMFIGQISPDEMTAAAGSDGQACEAAFYRGEWELLHQNGGLAEAAFRTAAAACPQSYVERYGAIAELARLSAR